MLVRRDSPGVSYQFPVQVRAAARITAIDGHRGTEGETRGSEYVEGDPLFINAAGADYHLRENSPAIDAGSAAGAPSDDFDGRSRPLDGNGDGTAAYDIGAYETPFYSEHVYLPIVLRGF